MLDLIAGKRRTGAVLNLAAPGGNANGAAVMTLSTTANMQGVKSMVIKRLKARSNGIGADTWLHIGTGAAGAIADALPALRIINNQTHDWAEYDMPEVEFALTLMAYADAFGAGSLDVQVEVEERG